MLAWDLDAGTSCLRRGSRIASGAVWFFALAAIVNGVAHPILAVIVGGYFPGLFSAPFLGAVGVWLLICLRAATDVQSSGPTPRDVALALETIAFTVVVPGAVTVWIPFDVIGFEPTTNPTAWTVWHMLAIVPLTIGFGIYVWCVCEFATHGRGIPAPIDHPKRLVVSGLYQYVQPDVCRGAPVLDRRVIADDILAVPSLHSGVVGLRSYQCHPVRRAEPATKI